MRQRTNEIAIFGNSTKDKQLTSDPNLTYSPSSFQLELGGASTASIILNHRSMYIKMGGVQVLGGQQVALHDIATAASTTSTVVNIMVNKLATAFNTLKAKLVNHGLLAST